MTRPIALKALQTFQGFLGTHEEGGNNEGFQVDRFLASVGLEPGQPWCAAAVRHCMGKAAGFLGLKLPENFPDSGYCPDYEDWAELRQKWIPIDGGNHVSPRSGDLCLFYFAAKGRVAHIGMVESYNKDGSFVTIEGNTSPESGVNRDGDGVYRKHRHENDLGRGGGFVMVDF